MPHAARRAAPGRSEVRGLRSTRAASITCASPIPARRSAPRFVTRVRRRLTGLSAASDITRCWPQASCLSQARRAASMPRTPPRPSNPRYVNGRQHIPVLLLRAAPAAQCLASCTRCARLRAIHGLPRLYVAARLRPRACPAPSAGAGARAWMRPCGVELAIHGSPASAGARVARGLLHGFGNTSAAREKQSHQQKNALPTFPFNCSLLSSHASTVLGQSRPSPRAAGAAQP